ncbi:MAG: hypothetical protein ACHQNE_00855 [Candidatus Kapaibacterium sp.]
MTRELSIEQVKGIFASKGVDFYYQLQHPGNAKIIFIGKTANRPEFNQFVLTEAHYLLDGPKWVEEHGIINPVLWMPGKVSAKPFWEPISRIWTGNNHERAAFLSSDARKISFVELCRWAHLAGEVEPRPDEEHLRFLGTLLSNPSKHIIIFGIGVLKSLQNAKVTQLSIKDVPIKDVQSKIRESGYWTNGHVTVVMHPSAVQRNNNNRWQPNREDRIIREILNQF